MNSTGAASLWRRIVNVGGVATEVLGIDATSGAPRLQVVVIPGNPGSSVYFRPFMAALHARLGGAAQVVAVTHAGHDPETDTGGRLWDLEQQVGHKVAFLREHVLLPGRPPVVLVGHSIGAAMMIQAVAQLDGLSAGGGDQPTEAEARGAEVLNPLASGPAAPAAAAAVEPLPSILKIVAVFPFFETNFGGNARQRRLRLLSPWYEALGWVGAAVTALPLRLRLAFVRANSEDMDPDAVYLTARLLSRHTCRNAFYLASHEFRDLSRPWAWGLMAALRERLHVMGCEEDTWLSRQQFDQMLAQVPGLQATWHPELRHAFCISPPQSTAVAEAIAAIAQPHLPAEGGGGGGCDVTASPSAASFGRDSDSSRSSSSSSSSAAPSPARSTASGSGGHPLPSKGVEGWSEQQRGPCGEGAADGRAARADGGDGGSGGGTAAGAAGEEPRRQPWVGAGALSYAASTFSLVAAGSSSGWGGWGARSLARRQAAGHGAAAR